MYPQTLDELCKDLYRKYSGTFVFGELYGIRDVFYIESFTVEDDILFIKLHSKHRMTETVQLTDEEHMRDDIMKTSQIFRIIYGLPRSKYVNSGRFAVYLYRTAARQYKAGACGSTYQLYTLRPEMAILHAALLESGWSMKISRPFPFSPSTDPLIYYKLFQPIYPTIQEAYHRLRHEQHYSVAISEKCALTVSCRHPEYLLVWKKLPVAKLLENKKLQISVFDESFKEEVASNIKDKSVEIV